MTIVLFCLLCNVVPLCLFQCMFWVLARFVLALEVVAPSRHVSSVLKLGTVQISFQILAVNAPLRNVGNPSRVAAVNTELCRIHHTTISNTNYVRHPEMIVHSIDLVVVHHSAWLVLKETSKSLSICASRRSLRISCLGRDSLACVAPLPAIEEDCDESQLPWA